MKTLFIALTMAASVAAAAPYNFGAKPNYLPNYVQPAPRVPAYQPRDWTRSSTTTTVVPLGNGGFSTFSSDGSSSLYTPFGAGTGGIITTYPKW